MQKKVAIFNDMSGFGRCSISVMLPILSAMGHQGVAIPTAVLSMHTEFPHFFMKDFTVELPAYLHSFQQEGIRFDAICTGFLGKEEQARILRDYLKKDRPSFVLVDPVMGDHGRCYPTISEPIIAQFRGLAAEADLLLPNVTELCLLNEMAYPQGQPSLSFLQTCCERLAQKGAKRIVVTGIEQDDRILNFIYDEGKVQEVWNRKVSEGRPGSGDVFAAVVAGALLQGKSLYNAVEQAAHFVMHCMEQTQREQTPHAYGLCFEPLLAELVQSKRGNEN